ncbi:hypothetical protein [Metabacillus arenae]|uniref:Uncharacterized protein n=1 Tax=Metabacillus arenae TaxID=2771434 RepID=A0A926NDY9_9BACI|nr:hypothetical protein [Metabacillus arenae]MBD1379481.1 hypothetical protein [Metabacillus arenae]
MKIVISIKQFSFFLRFAYLLFFGSVIFKFISQYYVHDLGQPIDDGRCSKQLLAMVSELSSENEN